MLTSLAVDGVTTIPSCSSVPATMTLRTGTWLPCRWMTCVGKAMVVLEMVMWSISNNMYAWRYFSSINAFGAADAIEQQWCGSTLAQVMDCCLTAPTHYLNRCWQNISKAQWHESKGNFTRDASAINHWNLRKKYLFTSSLNGLKGCLFCRVNKVAVVDLAMPGVMPSLAMV